MSQQYRENYEADLTSKQRALDERSDERDVAPEYSPIILSAYADGLVPTHILDRGLKISASTMKYPGRNTWPNDEFDVLLNGVPLESARVVYQGGESVVLNIPPEVCKALPDGVHEIAYRITFKPIGHKTRSGSSYIFIDRQRPGGRHLPRIEFPESLYAEPITSDTFDDAPDGKIIGIVPDYTWVSRDDTLHVYVRATGDEGILVYSVPASSDDRPTRLLFGPGDLNHASVDDRLAIYYTVEDRAGNLSRASSPSVHTVSLTKKV